MSDHHDARMEAGVNAMRMLEILDDEMIEASIPVVAEMRAFADRLRAAGASERAVAGTLLTLVVQMLIPREEP